MPARSTARVVAALLTLALLSGGMVVLAPAPPVLALHQHCGGQLGGTYSLGNGHPDPRGLTPRWGGTGVIHDLQIAERTIVFARNTLDGIAGALFDISDLIQAAVDAKVDPALAAGTPASQAFLVAKTASDATALALLTAGQVLFLINIVLFFAETAVAAALFVFETRVDDENGCGGTLGGDTATMTWVALVQRNLASSGPPLAMLMAPHQLPGTRETWPALPQTTAADFTAWCPDITALMGQLPVPAGTTVPETGGDCVSTVHLGFLDAPDIGVADITNNTIAHLQSHGVDVRDAPAIAAQADAALEEQRYSDAFHLYRQAYQVAMEVTSS